MPGKDATQGLSILLVDDEPFYYKALKKSLEEAGYGFIDFASTGGVALKKIKTNNYDVIVTDWHLPDINGFAFLGLLRHELKLHETFIVIISAEAKLDEEVGITKLGADGYLVKPFQPEDLIACVGAQMQHNRHHTDIPHAERSVLPILDTHSGIQEVGGDPANYRELLTDFIQELPEKIQLMYGFCEIHNIEKLSRMAHNLMGVAANLGAMQLSDLAHKVDEQSSAGIIDGLFDAVKDIEIAAQVLADFANSFMDNQRI